MNRRQFLKAVAVVSLAVAAGELTFSERSAIEYLRAWFYANFNDHARAIWASPALFDAYEKELLASDRIIFTNAAWHTYDHLMFKGVPILRRKGWSGWRVEWYQP